MRIISDRIYICRGEKLVPLGAEFLEGLAIYEFLEFGLELFLWGFFYKDDKYSPTNELYELDIL